MMDLSEIKRYVFEYADSNMYIITKNRSALVIDPNISENALQYLYDNNVLEINVILTHEHYDHTSGLTWLCERFKSTVICQEQTALSLRDGKNNRPIIVASSRMDRLPKSEIKQIVSNLPQNYSYKPDVTFTEEFSILWQGHKIHMISAPGHSKGSCCIEIDDNVVATGDSLILNTPVITRFLGGSLEQYENITAPYLRKIKDNTLILPGHGEMFFMKEARCSEKN